MNQSTPRAPSRVESRELALARLTTPQRMAFAHARVMARWVGLVLPFTLTLIATVITAMWVPRMPDPMAVHWGVSFEADGFGPPWSNVALAFGIGVLITLLYTLRGIQRMQPNAALWGPTQRFLPAMILGVVALIQVIAVGTAYVQLDYADAREAPGTGWVMLVGFSVWIVVTVIAYAVQPKLRIDAPPSAVAQPMPLAPHERAVWFGEVRPSAGLLWAVIPVTLVMFAAAVWSFATQEAPIVSWIMIGVVLLLVSLLATTLWFRVRIDAAGLEARAALGWPVFRVAADDVKTVQSVQISPFAEYGGWGVRHSPTGFGIVMRAGEGIVIGRRSRTSTFAITVDDSASAAALLAAMASQAQMGGAENA